MNQRGEYGSQPAQKPVVERPPPYDGTALIKQSLPVIAVGIGLVGMAVLAIMRHGTT